jgi:hypothetical protein
MPYVIINKTRYIGTASPSSLNVETSVVSISPQSDDYVVEGYINLSQLQTGDYVTIREYIALDGTNYYTYITASYAAPVADPIIRFHSKTLPYNAAYKVTVTQTAGTLRSFPYSFILMNLGLI